MTITFSLWMLVPCLLVIGAFVMFSIGGRQTGMLAGLFEGLVGIFLLVAAGAFMLGRWLA